MARCAGFIIFRRMQPEDQIQFLHLKRSIWSPPKGHVESGESLYQAALRETEEETGFKENVLKIVPDFKTEVQYLHKPKVVTLYLAELMNPKENHVVLSSEHCDFKWLPLKESMELNGTHGKKSHLYSPSLQKAQALLIEKLE